MLRANRAAFASGMTGCGKSQLLWDWFTSKHPRRLSYDPVGDSLERNPKAVAVRTAAEFFAHLKRATASGCDSWHFVLYGEAEEAAAALDRLSPSTAAPNEKTLARALGGVLFECGEIDTLAGNAGTPLCLRVRAKWQRGRHSLLSFAIATQAPALVSRIVTANSHNIYAFTHSEHTSLDYFAKTIGDRAAETIARLPQYAFVHYERGKPYCEEWVSEMRGRVIHRRKVRDIPLGISV